MCEEQNYSKFRNNSELKALNIKCDFFWVVCAHVLILGSVTIRHSCGLLLKPPFLLSILPLAVTEVCVNKAGHLKFTPVAVPDAHTWFGEFAQSIWMKSKVQFKEILASGEFIFSSLLGMLSPFCEHNLAALNNLPSVP